MAEQKAITVASDPLRPGVAVLSRWPTEAEKTASLKVKIAKARWAR